MPFFRNIQLALLTLLLLALAPVQAGSLAPGLEESFSSSGGEYLPVIVLFSEQVDAAALDSTLREAKLPLAARHAQLIDSLKTSSARSEQALAKSLDILLGNKLLRNPKFFWLLNGFSAEVTLEGARLLAKQAEVAAVGGTELLTARAPVESTPAEAKLLNVESSLRDLNAPQAWAEGFYGTGRIICLLDQSVRTDHPALGARWRGNHTARAESYFAEANLVEQCADDRLQVLGTACGADPEKGDTLGVAPGAEWIAGRLFCENSADFRELIDVLQWAADPDGNPESFQDVPDVIALAFGVGEGCNSLLPEGIWNLFANLERLGPICLFASSNNGAAGKSSVGLPEAAPGNAYTNFSVGNLDLSAPKMIAHATSGIGPSPCDPALIKPDLVAPGTKVRTTSGSGHAYITGTSAALGYLAGTAALMREANPELSAREAKTILHETATDLGLSGKDNVYGWGLLNTAKAVAAAKTAGSSGEISGLVRYGGIAQPGAVVELVSDFDILTMVTPANGTFKFSNLPTDREYLLHVSRFGFATWESPEPIVLEKNGKHGAIVNLKVLVRDDVEFDQGWIFGVSDDDATGGIWERAVPVPSFENGQPVQVGEDASESGRYCFVTGNADTRDDPAGVNDVDAGKTTLRSPVFNLRELDEPKLTFKYAYSNDRGGRKGGDFFRAQISNDGGATWSDLLRTSASTNGWTEVTLALDDFIESTDRMMLQFVCDDRPPATLVEAAVDEISITGKPGAPEPPRDLQIDVQFDQVLLNWRKSEGAASYNVYLGSDPNRIVLPENFFVSVADTFLVIPMSEIPYNQFYFQVTASR